MNKPKRFVAGAVCPQCAEMDRTVLYYNQEGEEVRECVSCGFSQTSNEQAKLDEQLATRVTPAGKVLYDEQERPLKIMGMDEIKKVNAKKKP